MTWWLALGIGLAFLLSLFALGIPIFVAFLIVNIVGVLAFFGPAGFGLFANSVFTTATTAALVTAPLFVLMGELLFRSGAMEVVLNSLDRLIGRIRGRQYVLCILLSAILGALSGAAIAVAGMLGRSLLPAMLKRGYDRKLSAGTILGGASLDPVIPPSVLAIIIGTLADVSIAALLIAGILPGLLLALLFLVYVLIRVWRDPSLAPEPARDEGPARGSKTMAVVRMAPAGLVFFMVIGLIMLGIATPSEAAATGVLGALAVAALYRALRLSAIVEALKSAVNVAGQILLIMCSAVMFSQLLTFTGATTELTKIVAGLELGRPLMLLLMMALPFVLFMFLDQVALMLVIIPIYQPLLKILGFDAVWFWTLFLINAAAGALTPPFGYVLFALKSAAPELTMGEIFSASWPFVWLLVLGIAILALFPPIVTFLPSLM
ncbi:MAG: TRAP transporter large permease subunit [Candidatus Odyssella sp.]|nr:TRAP transporter large permease subunit [Candidatus Odyssella sp.]